MTQQGGSEVARLLSQIAAEYESAQRGLCGLSYGTSQHEFVTTRMQNMHRYQQELGEVVGDEREATKLVAEALDALPDQSTTTSVLPAKSVEVAS